MKSRFAAAALALLLSLASHAQTDERKRLAFDVIDRNAEQLALVGDSLYYFGELGMQEFESAKFLKQTLEAIGFKVETGGAGFPTNVWAQWGSGKPKIIIVTEIDALPEGSQTPGSIERKPLIKGAPGHMEGHNTHGAVALGAAYAVKQVMERYKLPGAVAISFGPAEEQLVSRPFLVRAGLFKNADAALIIHIGDNFSTGSGLQNYAQLVNVGRGATLMTGTTMEMEVVASAWPQLGNRVLAEAIQKNIDLVGNPKWTAEEEKFAKDFQSALGLKTVGLNASPVKFGARPQSFASNDSGDVTWNVPTGNLNFPASVPGVNYHNWQAAVTPTSSIAHKGEIAGAKVLAASLLDLLTSPALVAKAKEQFQQDTRDTPYFSFLPADAKPPLELNREMMERFRPEMRKHYLNKTPRFN